jgi:hypothetical protein
MSSTTRTAADTTTAGRDPRVSDPKIVARKKEIQAMIKAENGGKPPSA